jgi:hypothetical protein
VHYRRALGHDALPGLRHRIHGHDRAGRWLHSADAAWR